MQVEFCVKKSKKFKCPKQFYFIEKWDIQFNLIIIKLNIQGSIESVLHPEKVIGVAFNLCSI